MYVCPEDPKLTYNMYVCPEDPKADIQYVLGQFHEK